MPRSKNGQLTQGDRMAIEQQLKDAGRCRKSPGDWASRRRPWPAMLMFTKKWSE
ncbi:hypothetical protein FHX70_001032 [Slackia isoflavoniconvertens]|nr:hypothetical protein [Slackia isoflavoniconvertens]